MVQITGKREAWVIFVNGKEKLEKALIILKSLRRVFTNRKVLLFITAKTPEIYWDFLESEFDEIHMLPDLPPGTGIEDVEILARTFCWSLVAYRKIAYLDISSLIMKNADSIFDLEGIHVGNGNMVLQPSFIKYRRLVETFCQSAHNNSVTGPVITKFLDYIIRKFDGKRLPEEYDFQTNSSPSHNNILIINLSGDISIKVTGFEYYDQQLEKAHSLYNQLKLDVVKIHPEFQDQLKPGAKYSNEPIAVVGLSCRLPGANNAEEYWKILLDKECCIRAPPEGRWTDEEPNFWPEGSDKIEAGFLKCPVDEFDTNFFGFDPKEAMTIDPQHRLLMEVTWEAFEDAAISVDKLNGSCTGVFSAMSSQDYHSIGARCSIQSGEKLKQYFGNSIGMAPARLAQIFGFTGPNLCTDSGCTSSSVAVGLGMKYLRSGEVNMAVAAGTNLILEPYNHTQAMGGLAMDNRIKSFDAGANGFVRAEGCAVLILKRLSDAVRNGDRIQALLRGFGYSQNGRSKHTFIPTVRGQVRAIQEAIEDASIRPIDVQLVEAHGVGTPVGDLMEMRALIKTFSSPDRKTPLFITSGKPNIGHTESAAGITQVIKTIMTIRAETVPPQIFFDKLNSKLDLGSIPALITTEPMTWISESKRISAVNTYSITGANTCVIIEEPPSHFYTQGNNAFYFPENLLTLSAKTESALKEMLEKYLFHLNENKHLLLDDVAYTANTGRTNFQYRVAMRGQTCEDIINRIKNNRFQSGSEDGGNREVCFIFTGSQTRAEKLHEFMYTKFPLFRKYFENFLEYFKSMYGFDLYKDIMLHKEHAGTLNEFKEKLFIFVIEYCQVKLWESWGVKPSCVVGIGLGEVIAATVAKLLTFQDAFKLLGLTANGIKIENNNFTNVSINDNKFGEKSLNCGKETQACVFVSSLDGKLMTQLDETYWIRRNGHTKLLTYALKETKNLLSNAIYLEIGGQSIVSPDYAIIHNNYLASPNSQVQVEGTTGFSKFLDAIGALYVEGVNINFDELHRYQNKKKVLLPFYPFQRQSFWLPTMDSTFQMGRKIKNVPVDSSVRTYESFQTEMASTEDESVRHFIIQKSIKPIIFSVMGLDPTHEIEKDQSFREFGLNSLMLMELKAKLENLLGPEVVLSIHDFMDTDTMEQLTSKVFNLLYNNEQMDEETRIDRFNRLLDADSELWKHIQVGPDDEPLTPLPQVSAVFLTGVTGNIGPYLLLELTKMSQIETVHCLVRSSKSTSAEERLQNWLNGTGLMGSIVMSKVKVVTGDVTKDKMGIELALYDQLAMNTQMVVHCVAHASHIEKYRETASQDYGVRAVNVSGTQRILEFAASRKVKWVYHSSSLMGMWVNSDEIDTHECIPEEWPSLGHLRGIPDFGYGITKNIADRLAGQAVSRGIPCKGFRLPKVFGESKTGRLDIKRNHFAFKFLYYVRTGLMPDVAIPLQVVPVDVTAQVTLQTMFNPEASSGMYNVFSPTSKVETDLTCLSREFGPLLRIAERFAKLPVGANVMDFLGVLQQYGLEIGVDFSPMVEIIREQFEITEELLADPAQVLENEDVRKFLAEKCGTDMRLVPYEEFVTHLVEEGKDSMLFPWLEFYTREDSMYRIAIRGEHDVLNRQKLKDNQQYYLSNGKLNHLIPDYNELIGCPLESVKKMISYTIRNSKEIFANTTTILG